MSRIYLNKKADNMVKVAKELGAEYIEDEEMIFVSKLWYEDHNNEKCCLGIAIEDDGAVSIGEIKKSCMNYSSGGVVINPRELKWAVKILTRINEYNKKEGKK